MNPFQKFAQRRRSQAQSAQGAFSEEEAAVDGVESAYKSLESAADDLQERLNELAKEYASLNAEQITTAKQAQEVRKRKAELRAETTRLTGAYKKNAAEMHKLGSTLKSHGRDVAKHGKEVGKLGDRYDELARTMASGGNIFSAAMNGLTKHTTALIAVAGATKAWTLTMSAATRGAKDLREAGVALPATQAQLNDILEAQAKKFHEVNKQAALMASKYGIAKDQATALMSELQTKLRYQGDSAPAYLRQMTENALSFAEAANVDVRKAMEFINEQRWQMTGSDDKIMRQMAGEMRAIHKAIENVNGMANNIFPEDLSNTILDLGMSTKGYADDLTALSAVMSKAYKESEKLGASYEQSINASKQLVQGLTNTDGTINYLAGRNLLKSARSDEAGFLSQIDDEGLRKRMKAVVNDASMSDFVKEQILAEALGNTRLGFAEKAREIRKLNQGSSGLLMTQQLLGYERLEDAQVAHKTIFEARTPEEAAANMMKLAKDLEEQAKKARGETPESAYTKKEQDRLAAVSATAEGSLSGMLRNYFSESAPWVGKIIDTLVEISNSATGVLKASAAFVGMHMLLKMWTGKFKVPLPVIMMGGSGAGAMGGAGGKGKKGKRSRRGGKFGKLAGLGAGAIGAASMFAPDIIGMMGGDADKAYATDDGGVQSALGTAVGVASMAEILPSLGSMFGFMDDKLAKGAGKAVAKKVAGKLGMAGAGAMLARVGLGGLGKALPVLGAADLGYTAGTYLDNATGASTALSGLAYDAFGSKGSTYMQEASAAGMSPREYWQYALGSPELQASHSPEMRQFIQAAKQDKSPTRSKEEIAASMLAAGRGHTRLFQSLGANLEMPEMFQGTFAGNMARSAGLGTPSAGARSAKHNMGRAATGEEGMLKVMGADATTGSLKLEFKGFYEALEAWQSDRSLLARMYGWAAGK